MTKINKHIEIVRSSESWLSSMGQVSAEGIMLVLAKHYTDVGITIINTPSDLEVLVAAKPDLVFLGMKFVPANPRLGWDDPNKIWLAEYFDQCGIAYTGSDQLAHQLELNKHLAKQRVATTELKTAPFHVVEQNDTSDLSNMSLNFPVFIKPTDRGGGQGIDCHSVAYNFTELKAKVRSLARDFQSDALIEEYLPGREFSVAILKDELTNVFLTMPLELIAPIDERGARILSSAVKTADTEHFAEVTDEIMKAKLTSLALSTFQALGARDYGRIDIRLDKDGIPHFLEANLLPSLIEGYGNFPKACLLNIGLDFEPMLLTIVRLGLGRSQPRIELTEASTLTLAALEPVLEPIVYLS